MRALLLSLLLALPAAAQTRMTVEETAGECFAVIYIINRAGTYNAAETLETKFGPVVVYYDTIGGHNPTDFDLVDVISLPDGVTAVPMHLDLPDGETGQVCLLEWLAG